LSYTSLINTKTLSNVDSAQNRTEFSMSEFVEYMQGKGYHFVTSSLAMQLYDKNSAVADAVDTIVKEVKNIIPVVFDGKEYSYKHEVLKLLHKPNPMNDYGDFIDSITKYKLLTANAFIVALGNSKFIPSELYLQPSTAINMTGSSESIHINASNPNALLFLNNNYVYDKKTGRYTADNFTELLHVRDFVNYSTTDGYMAGSKLSSIFYELEIMNQGNNHNMSLLMNGVNLNGVFNVDSSVESIDQFKQDIRTYFTGSSNAGKYLVSQGKTIEFRPIQMTNKDMEYEKTLSTVRKVIYGRFQIPGPLWSEEAQKYSNYQLSIYDLYIRAVLPEYKDIMRKFTSFFQSKKVLKPNEIITYDPTSIEVLQQRMLEEVKTKKDIGVYTNNEIRLMVGEGELGKENSLLYQQSNLVPVGTDIKQNNPEVKRFVNVLIKSGMDENKAMEKAKEIYDIQ